jgi:hypothetical protein
MDAWRNVTYHALNSVFALIEIILPRTEPLPWIHIFFILLIAALYLALGYLIFSTQRFYVYTFLNSAATGSGSTARLVFVLGAMTVAIFVAVNMLIWTRRYVTENIFGMNGKFAEQDVGEMGDADSEATAAGTEGTKLDDDSRVSSAMM